jgi:ABC-type phosphate/phosphonate transport system substrate-binding protein
MYLANRPAVAALWELLCEALAAGGLVDLPDTLTWPDDLHAHWLDPTLLLSQSCGYPYTDDLAGKVQLLGAFAYDAPQCSGIVCRSVLVARAEHGHLPLEGFRGLRAAFNVANSQSGYNAFRALVAPLAAGGRFFASALETGGHSASVAAVREGRADLAAIDCVTYAALARYTPRATDGLCIVATTEAYPGLPLVTAITTPKAEVLHMQNALRALTSSPQAASTLQALGIVGFEVPEPVVYQRCVDMRTSAHALGYPLLA